MRAWAQDNVSHVATMSSGDFYGSEQSVIMPSEDTVNIVFRWLGQGLIFVRDSDGLYPGLTRGWRQFSRLG